MKRYEVLVRIVMDADNETEVTDGLHDTFEEMEQRGAIVDWGYHTDPSEVKTENKIKCAGCGISIPDPGEGQNPVLSLCDRCYNDMEVS